MFLYLPQNSFIIDVANKDYVQLILLAGIILISIFVFINIFIFCVNYFQAAIFQNVKIINSKRMFQAYLTSPYSFHLNRNPAILTRDILGNVHHASKFLGGAPRAFYPRCGRGDPIPFLPARCIVLLIHASDDVVAAVRTWRHAKRVMPRGYPGLFCL